MPSRTFRISLKHRCLAFVAVGLLACDSELTIGRFTCPAASTSNVTGSGGASGDTVDLAVPWSTGFEIGFCDYFAGGFCYERGNSAFEIVTAPVHSGSFAAAYSVVADGNDTGTQARCVREGALPDEGYYGAYYFIPSSVTNQDLWNLFHFQGGSGPSDTLHGLWDVSLINDTNGDLELVVFEFLSATTHSLPDSPRVPTAQWFHLEVYLKRASDSTGAFSLYLDDINILELTDLVTDDSTFGQWYVGNLATQLVPQELTLYVDDVTIQAVP